MQPDDPGRIATPPVATISVAAIKAGGQGRYVTLDGMRGIAALAVALFHFNISQAPHGYVAVDFFFALSGFVLCRTYEPRWKAGLGTLEFMRQRIVRLYPLFLTGIVVTSIATIVQGNDPHSLRVFAMSTALNALMIPSPLTITLFPFNVPAWSLFFELVANLAMITVLLRLPRLALLAMCLACAWHLAPQVIDNGSGNLGAVWAQWQVSLTRTALSFGAGMLIAGLPTVSLRKAGLGGLLCLIAITACLLVQPGEAAGPYYDLLFTFALSPLLVWCGAQVEPPRLLQPAARFLGDVSYGLYAVHWGLMGLFRHFKDGLGYDPVLMAIAYLGTGVILAWCASRWIDRPLRTLLSRKKRQNISSEGPVSISHRPS